MNKLMQTEGGRDAVAAAPAAVGGAAAHLTSSEVLTYVTILYMVLLCLWTVYRWWITHRKLKHWERQVGMDTDSPADPEPHKPGGQGG